MKKKTKWFDLDDYDRKKILSQIGDLAMTDDRFLEEIQEVVKQYTIKHTGILPTYTFDGGPSVTVSNEQKEAN